jgi:two-component system OmpR family sensor kinase
MTLSLRGRLLIGVIALLVVGLIVSDIVTYTLMQKSLLDGIDKQLTTRSTRDTAVAVLSSSNCIGRGPGPSASYPTGTVAELLGPDGSVIAGCRVGGFPGSSSSAKPVLPKSLPNAGMDHQATPFTVQGAAGVAQFRITDWPEDSFSGQYVVFAIPLTDTNNILSSLLLLEAVIGFGVVAATILFALIIIQLGLRPLQKMGGVAAQIAAGDLSRRVEPATQKT